MQTQSGAVNLHAQQMSLDAEEAMSVAVAGDVLFAHYTTNVICADADESKVEEAVGLVVKTIQSLGFAARIEDVNSVEAWIGSLPGTRKTRAHSILPKARLCCLLRRPVSRRFVSICITGTSAIR